MLLILTSAILPLLLAAQNTLDQESSQKPASIAPSEECITLAKEHESQCRPVFSNASLFFKVCPKAADCSLEEKQKAIEPVCSNIDTMQSCYKSLTPVCYSKQLSDAVLAIFESECASLTENSSFTTDSSIDSNPDTMTVTSSAAVAGSTDIVEENSGSLYVGLNSILLVFLGVLSI